MYTPPIGDEADLILGAYTPPTGDEVDFEMAGGATAVIDPVVVGLIVFPR